MSWKVLAITLSVLICSQFWSSETVVAQHFAKYASDFLSVGAGPQALAMGRAFVAVAEGNISAYWNPAGLARLPHPELHLMYAERFGGIVKSNFAIFAAPMKNQRAFAVSIMRLGVDDIYATALLNPDLPIGAMFEDENGRLVRNTPYIEDKFKDVEYVGFISFARAGRGNRFFGGNIKLIYKALGKHSAWGIGFDFGVLLPLYKGLRLGANLQDATSTLIAWDTGNKELASPNLKVGLAYPVQWKHFRFLPAVDGDFRFEGRNYAAQAAIGPVSLDLHAGLEVGFRDVAFLRLGYDRGDLAAGAGFQLPKLRFDAAFLTHSTLGDTYRISMTVSFYRDE